MQFKRIDEPLGFDELWHAAGVSKSLAQNWTNGRPFRVLPSLSVGAGKGSRNIYALADAYFLAMLQLLKVEGFSSDRLKRIVRSFNLRVEGEPPFPIRYFAEPAPGISISGGKLTLSFGPVQFADDRSANLTASPLVLNAVHESITIQVIVNLNKLREDVNYRLDSYRRKAKRGNR